MTFIGDFVTGQTVTFQRARKLLFDQGGGVQEGVINAADLMVTQRAAGATMSVDVAAGFAWVQIDTGTNNGVCHVTSDAVANVAVTAAHATLPRIDQLILRYNDTAIPTGAGNTPTPEILTGTATSGATNTNRLGAAALPNDCMRLADFLVPAVSSSVVNTNIRDRRLFARGGFLRLPKTAGSYTTASTSLVQLDSSLTPRLECSGVPVRISLFARVLGATSGTPVVSPRIDSTVVDSGADIWTAFGGAASGDMSPALQWVTVPTAGSHVFDIAWRNSTAATITMMATATSPLVFVVEEIVRQNTQNNSVTSG